MTWDERIEATALNNGITLDRYDTMLVRDIMRDLSPLPLSELSREEFDKYLDAALKSL